MGGWAAEGRGATASAHGRRGEAAVPRRPAHTAARGKAPCGHPRAHLLQLFVNFEKPAAHRRANGLGRARLGRPLGRRQHLLQHLRRKTGGRRTWKMAGRPPTRSSGAASVQQERAVKLPPCSGRIPENKRCAEESAPAATPATTPARRRARRTRQKRTRRRRPAAPAQSCARPAGSSGGGRREKGRGEERRSVAERARRTVRQRGPAARSTVRAAAKAHLHVHAPACERERGGRESVGGGEEGVASRRPPPAELSSLTLHGRHAG